MTDQNKSNPSGDPEHESVKRNSTRVGPPTHRLYELIEDADLPLKKKQRRLLEQVKEYLGVTNGYIQSHSTDSKTDEILVSVGDDPDLFPEGETYDRSNTYCRRTVKETAPIALSNVPDQGWENDPAYKEHDASCYLGTTLFVGGEVYGTLCFVQREPREAEFSPEEKMFVELAARLLGRQIEAIQHEQVIAEKKALQTELEKTTKGTLQLASELEQRYQHLFERAVEGIYTTTKDLDEYVMANPAFADLLGYESGEAVCEAIDSIEDDVFVDPDTYAEYAETLQTAGEIAQFEYRVRTADGETRWVSDSVRALTDDVGDIEGYRGGVIDITEQKTQERNLRQQTNLSIVLNRVLRHNLRNDVSVVRGFTQMMADELDNDTYGEKALHTIDGIIELTEKARELDEIVARDTEPEPANITDLIDEVVTQVRRDYPSATIVVEADEEITAAVLPSFERAIRELVENAAKHSGDEPIVEVRAEPNLNDVQIHIEDDGPGIEEQEIAVLQSGSETPLMHGSGLGLWLTHWIVTSHEGAIDATVTDEGTTLTVSVPRTSSVEDQEQLTEIVRARDQYKASFEEAGDGMIISDDEARILDVNDEAARIFGVNRKKLPGRALQDFVPDEFDFETEWGEMKAIGMKRGQATVMNADGGVIPVEYTAKNDIVPGQHLIVLRDVTEREEREQELKRTNKLFEQAQAVGEVGWWQIDIPSEDITWSRQVYEMWGAEGDISAIDYETFLDFVHPEDAAYVDEQWEAAKNGQPYDIEHRIITGDGDVEWMREQAELTFNEDGKPVSAIGIVQDITELKEREQEIQQLTERLELAVEGAELGVWDWDMTTGEVEFNEQYVEMLGYSKEDFGHHVDDWKTRIHPKDRERVENSLDGHIAGETEYFETEYRLQTAEGDWKWVRSMGRIVDRDENGAPVRAVGIHLDITDRKGRERQVMEMKERYQTLLEAAPDPVIVADVETGEIIEVSETAETLFEMPSDEIIGLAQSDLHPPDQAEPYRELFEEHVKRGGTKRRLSDGSPIYILTANGDHIPVEISVSTVPLPDGPVMYGIFRDISEQVERERQIEHQKAKFQGVFEDSFDAMVIADDEGRYIDVNESATDLFGVSEDELLGRSIAEFAPEDFDFAEAWQEFQESEKQRGTFPLVRADGDERVVEFAATRDIVPGKHLSILRDITDRKEREQELAEKNRQLEAIVQNTEEAIYIKDTSGYYQFINESGAELFDLSAEEVIGKHDEDLFDQESAADIRREDEKVMESGQAVRKETVRYIKGKKHVFLDAKYPYRDENGEVIGLIGISPDITERKEQEWELQRQNERLDEFASVISHDLRNPLNVAQGRIKLAQEEYESEHLDAAAKGVERSLELIENLLAHARGGQEVGEMEPEEMTEVVQTCWESVETANATVVTDLESTIQADRSRLCQLLENLFRNAIESGGEDVTITVGSLPDGFYVEDDGPGIPEKERENVIQPGYSESPERTGFGLYIVQQIVEAHGWDLRISEGSEGGARFEITDIEFAAE